MKSIKQRALYVTGLISECQKALNLQEWMFSFNITPKGAASVNAGPQEEVYAEICAIYAYKTADITIFPGFWEVPPHIQRHVIMHELCHCHTQQLLDYLTDFGNGQFHTPKEIGDAVETLTQRIAVMVEKASKKK